MTDFTPVSSLLGGVLIGASCSLVLLYLGRIVGISGMLNAVITRPDPGADWRLPFLLGLLAVGFVARFVAPHALGPAAPGVIPLAIAGILVGFGTRLGNGCTSGHGISGLSRLSRRSAVATAVFMAAGMIATYVALRIRG